MQSSRTENTNSYTIVFKSVSLLTISEKERNSNLEHLISDFERYLKQKKQDTFLYNYSNREDSSASFVIDYSNTLAISHHK